MENWSYQERVLSPPLVAQSIMTYIRRSTVDTQLGFIANCHIFLDSAFSCERTLEQLPGYYVYQGFPQMEVEESIGGNLCCPSKLRFLCL